MRKLYLFNFSCILYKIQLKLKFYTKYVKHITFCIKYSIDTDKSIEYFDLNPLIMLQKYVIEKQ